MAYVDGWKWVEVLVCCVGLRVKFEVKKASILCICEETEAFRYIPPSRDNVNTKSGPVRSMGKHTIQWVLHIDSTVIFIVLSYYSGEKNTVAFDKNLACPVSYSKSYCERLTIASLW